MPMKLALGTINVKLPELLTFLSRNLEYLTQDMKYIGLDL